MTLSHFKDAWLQKQTPIAEPWGAGIIKAYGQSHAGMVRESNQDSFGILTDYGIFVVADGVGGHAGGEIASQMAVQLLQEEVRKHLGNISKRDSAVRQQIFAQAINTASLKIFERSLEMPQYRGMGTTTTLLWVPPAEYSKEKTESAVVAHVGDSRCYLLRSGFLYQLTDDHSFLNEQIKLGRLKATDPIASQVKNVITRCVGSQEEEEVDTVSLPVFKNDRFLLCSDGLSNKVNDTEIAELLGLADISQVPHNLIRLANDRGGEDNVSVVVIELT